MDKVRRRRRRKISIRKKISGTAERPRMCISRSNKNISVQLIDDLEGKTLCAITTRSRDFRGKALKANFNNVETAKSLGEEIAKLAKPKGVKKVVFDRSGYPYHGVVKALADTARENGLEF
ncbi:MAG: 50S ribosomal protein L18 [Candidatus Omnitrophica bacterium]|nr:50S ribosomal protein L18 [Candidatus Omnitrophota bacterium]